MNWKNITIENGFIKQEINLKGTKATNYIPLNQIDSFGIVNSENKRWLHAGIFFGFCALIMAISQQVQSMIFLGMIAAGLVCVYFLSRQTWFTITSNQTKFLVNVTTTKEEIQAVNAFITQIKQEICSLKLESNSKAA